MRYITFDVFGELLLICARCGDTFLQVSEEPTVIDLPNGWHVVVLEDLCPTCLATLRHQIGLLFPAAPSVDSPPPESR